MITPNLHIASTQHVTRHKYEQLMPLLFICRCLVRQTQTIVQF